MIDVEKDFIPQIKNGFKKNCSKEEVLLILNLIPDQLNKLIKNKRIRIINNKYYNASDVLVLYKQKKTRGTIFIIIFLLFLILTSIIAISIKFRILFLLF